MNKTASIITLLFLAFNLNAEETLENVKKVEEAKVQKVLNETYKLTEEKKRQEEIRLLKEKT